MIRPVVITTIQPIERQVLQAQKETVAIPSSTGAAPPRPRRGCHDPDTQVNYIPQVTG
ncbi:MAG: hypothetical protein R3C00_09525 [Hyphomonas sp.]